MSMFADKIKLLIKFLYIIIYSPAAISIELINQANLFIHHIKKIFKKA